MGIIPFGIFFTCSVYVQLNGCVFPYNSVYLLYCEINKGLYCYLL